MEILFLLPLILIPLIYLYITYRTEKFRDEMRDLQEEEHNLQVKLLNIQIEYWKNKK